MTNIDWETRAKERRLENKALKKRIAELTKSRDVWKEKSVRNKAEVDELKSTIEQVKKNVILLLKIQQ